MDQQRLFIDCDDTLILFDSKAELHPYGFWRHDPYKINQPLVDYALNFMERNPGALVAVWSGGGKEYARAVADEVFPNLPVQAMIKDHTTLDLVRIQDVVFDDVEIKVPCYVFKPDALDILYYTAV